MKTFIFDTETTGLPQTKGFNNYYIYSDLINIKILDYYQYAGKFMMKVNW